MAPSRTGGLRGLPVAALALLGALFLLPATPMLIPGPDQAAVAADRDWSRPRPVTAKAGSRLDSLHQLAAAGDTLHLVHPRIGPRERDDRVVYQRSTTGGRRWSSERVLFSATPRDRDLVPNLALDAQGRTVIVAWRVRGSGGTTLFARTSTNAGLRFGPRVRIAATRHRDGLGVPAVAVGDGFVAVAWTDRGSGRVKVSRSTNGGRSYQKPDVLGRTRLSIECRTQVLDGLVGMAASGRRLHVAWSKATAGDCLADSIDIRSSADGGRTWSKNRTVTGRRSYGWAELDARGRTVLASVQLPAGDLLVARSGDAGRRWRSEVLVGLAGRAVGSGDVLLLSGRRAAVTYVEDRLSRGRPVSTRLRLRLSRDDGADFGAALTVLFDAKQLRQAPNIAVVDGRLVIVLQTGALDGSPRQLVATRQR